MDNETTTTVEDDKKPRINKMLAAKIAAGTLAFGTVCALAVGIVKSGHNTTD